jgi:hypothetical protein
MAETEPDYEALLAAQPETARKIGEFLAHPEIGVRRERPAPRLRRAAMAPTEPLLASPAYQTPPAGYVDPGYDYIRETRTVVQPVEFDDSDLNGTI